MTQAPLGWIDWRDADGRVCEFLELLKGREFATTCCDDCDCCFFPPQGFCPECFSGEVSFKQPDGKATLYAFTQIDKSFRFAAPDVIGVVEIEGVKGRVFSRIDAPIESLEIGMDLDLDFVDVGDGYLLHQFRPVA